MSNGIKSNFERTINSKRDKRKRLNYVRMPPLRDYNNIYIYWDHGSNQPRVRLDGYGANGPLEVLVNMIAVDNSIKAHFRSVCMTCGHDIFGAAKSEHFHNGVCNIK